LIFRCVFVLLFSFRTRVRQKLETVKMYSWSRPENIEFPQIYSRFVALDCDSEDKVVEYRVEDLQEDRFEDAVTIIRDKHLMDEPMKSSKGVRDCPVSVQEMIENLWNMLRQKISLVCYRKGSDEIVAVNILGVITETESDAPLNVSIFNLLDAAIDSSICNSIHFSIVDHDGLNITIPKTSSKNASSIPSSTIRWTK